MSTDIASLGLEIDSSDVKRADNELDKLTGSSKRAERATDKFGNTAGKSAAKTRIATTAIRSMSAALVGVAAGAGAFLAASLSFRTFVNGTVEAERSQTLLASALKSTQAISGQTIASLNAQAAALQQLTVYGDEATNRAQALLLTFTKIRGDTFPRATEATLDLAAAMGTDLKSASIQVGKALNDPVLGISALTRSGITFSEQQKKTIKSFAETGQIAKAQTIILKELETQFGGTARAAKQDLGGAITSLENNFGDLFEITTGAGRDSMVGSINELTAALSSPDVVQGMNDIGNGVFFIGSAVSSVAAGLAESFGDLAANTRREIETIGTFISDLSLGLASFLTNNQTVVNAVVGLFVGGFRAISAVWSALPNLLGNISVQTANAVILQIEGMTNRAISGLNALIALANNVPGVNLGSLGGISIGQLSNQFAGAGTQLAESVNTAFRDALNTDFVSSMTLQLETFAQTVTATSEGNAVAGEVAANAMIKTTSAAANAAAGVSKVSTEVVNLANESAAFTNTFIGELRQGISLTDALGNAVDRLITKLIEAAVQAAFLNLLTGGTAGGGGFTTAIFGGGSNSLGSVLGFANGGIVGAGGGVVTQPTFFGMGGGGLGVAGETPQPEGILPLRRGANGQMGVQVFGDEQQQQKQPVVNLPAGAERFHLTRREMTDFIEQLGGAVNNGLKLPVGLRAG